MHNYAGLVAFCHEREKPQMGSTPASRTTLFCPLHQRTIHNRTLSVELIDDCLMPLDIQIIRANEFIRLGAKGRVDLKASREILAEIARACRKRGVNRALLDVRALHVGPKPVFSIQDVARLVSTFHEIGFRKEQRLAILYSADPHHRARLFAFLSSLHGWQVRAFGGFEKAIAWLWETEAVEKTGPFERVEEVPVRVRRRPPNIPHISRN
jgi:hypothetical protein